MSGQRPRLAMYWASACGGCEVAVLNLGEKILLLDRLVEIAFFPCIADFKLADLRSYPDGHIDLCLFNGAIRSSEDREMARLLRAKSRLLVAFGSCAHEGCVPALINLSTTAEALTTVYLDCPTVDNPDRVVPRAAAVVAEGELRLPLLADTVRTLEQVEEVDYTVPGCPPEPHQVWSALEALVAGLSGDAPLPPPGAVLGAAEVGLCEECPLERREQPVAGFVRPHELVPDPDRCLLDQGLVCLGVATRGGCGALCPRVGMGCRGCYGGTEESADQGAKNLAALAACVHVGAPGDDEEELREAVAAAMSSLVDPVGTAYRFSLARSLLRRARRAGGGREGGGHGPDQH